MKSGRTAVWGIERQRCECRMILCAETGDRYRQRVGRTVHIPPGFLQFQMVIALQQHHAQDAIQQADEAEQCQTNNKRHLAH